MRALVTSLCWYLENCSAISTFFISFLILVYDSLDPFTFSCRTQRVFAFYLFDPGLRLFDDLLNFGFLSSLSDSYYESGVLCRFFSAAFMP